MLKYLNGVRKIEYEYMIKRYCDNIMLGDVQCVQEQEKEVVIRLGDIYFGC